MTMYKLSWEMVRIRELWRFCNANPTYYKNVTQTVSNSQIPDEYWYLVSKETDNPWDQAGRLKDWERADEQFVRKVKLEKLVSSPVWQEIPITTEGSEDD